MPDSYFIRIIYSNSLSYIKWSIFEMFFFNTKHIKSCIINNLCTLEPGKNNDILNVASIN